MTRYINPRFTLRYIILHFCFSDIRRVGCTRRDNCWATLYSWSCMYTWVRQQLTQQLPHPRHVISTYMYVACSLPFRTFVSNYSTVFELTDARKYQWMFKRNTPANVISMYGLNFRTMLWCVFQQVIDIKRYDTITYFYLQSKADVNQLNLPHGTKHKNGKNKEKIKKNNNRYAHKKRSGQESVESVLGGPSLYTNKYVTVWQYR